MCADSNRDLPSFRLHQYILSVATPFRPTSCWPERKETQRRMSLASLNLLVARHWHCGRQEMRKAVESYKTDFPFVDSGLFDGTSVHGASSRHAKATLFCLPLALAHLYFAIPMDGHPSLINTTQVNQNIVNEFLELSSYLIRYSEKAGQLFRDEPAFIKLFSL